MFATKGVVQPLTAAPHHEMRARCANVDSVSWHLQLSFNQFDVGTFDGEVVGNGLNSPTVMRCSSSRVLQRLSQRRHIEPTLEGDDHHR